MCFSIRYGHSDPLPGRLNTGLLRMTTLRPLVPGPPYMPGDWFIEPALFHDARSCVLNGFSLGMIRHVNLTIRNPSAGVFSTLASGFCACRSAEDRNGYKTDLGHCDPQWSCPVLAMTLSGPGQPLVMADLLLPVPAELAAPAATAAIARANGRICATRRFLPGTTAMAALPNMRLPMSASASHYQHTITTCMRHPCSAPATRSRSAH